MRSSEIHNSIKQLKTRASADLDCRVHGGIDEALASTTEKRPVRIEPFFGRNIMKKPLFKLAIAAAIAVVVMVVMNQTEQVTFAKVIEPLKNFTTIALDFITGDEGSDNPIIHDVIKGNRIRRTISNVDMIMVLDLDSRKMMLLNPATKQANYVGTEGIVNQGTQELLEMVKTIVSQVERDPGAVTKLGRRDMHGIETVGFQIKNPKVTINLWADPVTATPKHIELIMGQNMSVLTNIEFDIPVSDDEVSMEIPEGYTQAQESMAMGEPTEEDLLVTLGIWAEKINGGAFPDEISTALLVKLLPDFSTALGQMEGSAQELTDLGMNYGRTTVFLTLLGQQGEWHYAGQGVSYGDRDTAVFWYRFGAAKTYRVIYGDLHVEEVALDALPQ